MVNPLLRPIAGAGSPPASKKNLGFVFSPRKCLWSLYSYTVAFFASPSGNIILNTKKNITMDTPPVIKVTSFHGSSDSSETAILKKLRIQPAKTRLAVIGQGDHGVPAAYHQEQKHETHGHRHAWKPKHGWKAAGPSQKQNLRQQKSKPYGNQISYAVFPV